MKSFRIVLIVVALVTIMAMLVSTGTVGAAGTLDCLSYPVHSPGRSDDTITNKSNLVVSGSWKGVVVFPGKDNDVEFDSGSFTLNPGESFTISYPADFGPLGEVHVTVWANNGCADGNWDRYVPPPTQPPTGTPEVTPSATPSPSPTVPVTETVTPSPSPTVPATETPTDVVTPSATPSGTPSGTPTDVVTPSVTPVPHTATPVEYTATAKPEWHACDAKKEDLWPDQLQEWMERCGFTQVSVVIEPTVVPTEAPAVLEPLAGVGDVSDDGFTEIGRVLFHGENYPLYQAGIDGANRMHLSRFGFSLLGHSLRLHKAQEEGWIKLTEGEAITVIVYGQLPISFHLGSEELTDGYESTLPDSWTIGTCYSDGEDWGGTQRFSLR